MATLIGASMPRVEDRRLLPGAGRFAADHVVAGAAHAVFVRSPHAHARIAAIDSEAARRAPGVLAVLTAHDYIADGLRGLNHHPVNADHLDPQQPAFVPAELLHAPPLQMPLALERVRHVGEAVALVVAETPGAAQDAADLVAVRYEPLAAVSEPEAALGKDAPVLWPDAGDNLFLRAEKGDEAAVARALASAHRVVRLETRNQRVLPMPLEPRAATASWDEGTGRYTIHSPSQGVHRQRAGIISALGVAPDRVRVVTGDVGGGFGVRSPCYAEYPLLCWAARRVRRPVRWLGTRAEGFLSDMQAREATALGTLALDRHGRFLALAIDYLGNLGSHPASYAVAANILRMAEGVYDIPALHVRVRWAVTNTLPVGVYRGAGRPESCFALERLIDLAAGELKLDRAELRRRNLIKRLPYQSPLGHRYDSGEFAGNLASALRLLGWDDFPKRRREAAARGKLAGVGVANYLESPTGMALERTDLVVRPEGRVTAVIGTGASGQGHETSFAQVVASELEIPFERVAILYGDSDVAVAGGGSHSDRSMRLAGTILLRASRAVIEKGRLAAAQALEADAADIAYEAGRFFVAGTDRAIGLFELAAATPLADTQEITTRLHAHPTGAAAAEVEIDAETGAVGIVRYVSVDDVGSLVNPMIVEGQVHGGIAQGVGQALMEDCVYDAEAQLLTGSFMDYAMPRADDLPDFATLANPTPAESNPLGVKGAGECGTTPATSAIVNAICDALGVRHIEMPATAERLWRALKARQEA